MDRINVTKTFLPPIEEYQAYLQKIWDSSYLTNQGPLLTEFESKVSSHLGIDEVQLVTNGTIALQLALRALDITGGEVITTPFSYVATTSAILWEHCTPVYVDIDPKTFCMDPAKIEAAITPQTKAIMPVHVYGFPCDTGAIDAIAEKHDLKVIYDGAQAFGTIYKDKSLLGYGDISICSLHSTKLFHTIEGGLITTHNQEVYKKIDLMKRFGHWGDDHTMLGINGKASEFQAAMGLANLPYIDKVISGRKAIYEAYANQLSGTYELPQLPTETTYNYAYFPVLFKDETTLLKVVEALNRENIFPRRYFYPSLNKLPYLKTSQSCPISEDIAVRVLCLPMYVGLEPEIIEKICVIVKGQHA